MALISNYSINIWIDYLSWLIKSRLSTIILSDSMFNGISWLHRRSETFGFKVCLLNKIFINWQIHEIASSWTFSFLASLSLICLVWSLNDTKQIFCINFSELFIYLQFHVRAQLLANIFNNWLLFFYSIVQLHERFL